MAGVEILSRTKRLLVLLAAGIIAIGGANYFLSQRLGSSIIEGLLAREGQVKQEFLSSILAAGKGEADLFAPPRPSAALLAFGEQVRGLSGIVRANVYSPDGFIRYSTDANLIGVQFEGNPELAEAFAGKIISAFAEKPSSDKSEHLALNQIAGEKLIEVYVPVRGQDGRIVTVVEFYRKDDWIQAMASDIERSFLLSAALCGTIVAIALMLAFRAEREPA